MTTTAAPPIALALSGGGIRAMAFHLGVLKRMAERGLLERVTRLSTVSGGSLLMGLLYRSNDFRWPTSQQFLDRIYPSVGEQLCSRSLQAGAFLQLLRPWNWRFCLSRANLLALELRKNWGLNVPLSAISLSPEWSINGTTAENGKRFRFKGAEIGDWELGYAQAPSFPFGSALAVSAAFPIGFGPLTLRTDAHAWKKRAWDAPKGSEQVVDIGTKRLHLYDGGLYDNLGAEPFFHPGKQQPKNAGDYIIVSDAGAPLPLGLCSGPLNPFRIKRMMEIMSEQSRSLRIRAFTNYLQANPGAGAQLLIGTPVTGPNCAEARFARSFPTSLKRLSRADFERLAGHGHDVARDTEMRFGLA
ncbi:MAG: patatin-like phospholipase family protein [Metallibacterium scheffleri]|jgi:NTE family protein|uniref:patatin-like phospholipase family protein n=1 Tax=Metallibacterium scheffleri TaxID=993689 RepID=UPI0026EDF882|nr:patatin-like phospholipase family protein [Metallibacterium scheffleri]MCK9366568.1 patatin-like phospholipase family protein [Metallibacterium scheffleri]